MSLFQQPAAPLFVYFDVCAYAQVRHRNAQETLLVRVDVRSDVSGVLLVTLAPQPHAFSPYRCVCHF